MTGSLSRTHTSVISLQTIPERACTTQSYAGTTKRAYLVIIGMNSPTFVRWIGKFLKTHEEIKNNMKIEHIALYVNDLEASRNFFVKFFGATSNDGYCNPKTNFRSYFLSFEDSSRLELMSKLEMSDPPKSLARTGYVHIAFRVGSREKVDELTAALQADGYEVVSSPRTTGDGYYESCILDAEQNQIEITI